MQEEGVGIAVEKEQMHIAIERHAKCLDGQMLRWSIVKCTNAQKLKCTNCLINNQMHKCTNAQALKCTNAQTVKCTKCKCSNAQMVKCSNAQMLNCSNAQTLKWSNAEMLNSTSCTGLEPQQRTQITKHKKNAQNQPHLLPVPTLRGQYP